MKVLDPQSALLTNAEVYQFLQSNPPRKAETQIGSYPVTNLTGHVAIRRDFDRYTEEITPHVAHQVNAEKWMPELVRKLKPYDLMKTEVLNLINIGIGMRTTQPQEDVKSEDGEEQSGQEAEMARDVQFFKIAVDEVDERFPGDEGEERIREVVAIMRNTIAAAQGVDGMNGVEVNGNASGST